MHASIKVDVFLSIVSNPIVEDCHGIRFTSYPQTLLAPERSGEGVRITLVIFTLTKLTKPLDSAFSCARLLTHPKHPFSELDLPR